MGSKEDPPLIIDRAQATARGRRAVKPPLITRLKTKLSFEHRATIRVTQPLN